MVSKSVDSLLKKNYLSSKTDSSDKRLIHLVVEPVAIPLIKKLLVVQKSFLNVLFTDITEEEYEQTKRVLHKINKNLSKEYEEQ